MITLAPTGATPRMLVPVTVTDSTGASPGRALCANAGTTAVAAMKASVEPLSLSCRDRIRMTIPLLFPRPDFSDISVHGRFI